MSARRLLAAIASSAAPAEFGASEDEVVRRGCGLGLRTCRATFRIAGDDRYSFLNRILTASVQPRGAGTGRRTLLLDNKGRVQADLDLVEAESDLLALTAAHTAPETVAILSRFVLRADVQITPGDEIVLALVGPGVSGVLGAEVSDDADRPTVQATTLGGIPVQIAWATSLPQGAEIVLPASGAPAVVEALLAAGAVPVGSSILETLRVEAGVPSSRRELAERPFPQEVGLVGAVDFEKGCYLGQETVARIHYRGHVNRELRGLVLSAPVEGGTLVHGEKPAGQITSAVVSERFGPIGLAFVRAEAVASRELLHVSSANEGIPEPEPVTARVVELPFV